MRRREPTVAGAHPLLAVFLTLLVCLLPATAPAEWIDLGGDPVAVEVLESDGARSVVEITVGGFEAAPVEIDGRTYYRILLDEAAPEKVAGLPELPNLRRSLVIPDDAMMAVRILDSQFVDLPGMPVAPSKGHLLRSVDPAGVPYAFDDFYATGGTWPAEVVVGEDPYILRDVRGMLLDANVFQYLTEGETLRVWTRLVVEIVPIGAGSVNVLDRVATPQHPDQQFTNLYERHFLNYKQDRYTPVGEEGGLLIIAYDAFAASMAPLVEWKLQKGIPTRLVTLSETGSSSTQIAGYIQDEYDTWNLANVLLIGDGPQIPIPSGGADPVYSLVAGGDNYPDIFIGRFSAENTSQVATQVERTIRYERDVTAAETWMQYGMGVASNQGPGDDDEYDDEHLDVIRLKLLDYGYIAVDQIYDPTGTATMVANGLNAGRGIVNYTGHGSPTSWGSTGFSNTHVNALVNDNMLPFVVSVACNNGTFTSTTCFAEAWQRATNGGTPTGAIAGYMSYISQSWDPPMCAQDEAVDLLVADEKRTIGGLWFNGSCQMMDEYGAGGVNEFKNWVIFGDPSLAVRTKQAQVMAVNHSGALFIGMSEYDVNVPGFPGALCALYNDGTLYGSAYADAGGHALITIAAPPTEPMVLTLTVTAYNTVTHMGTVEVLPPSGPYLVYESVTVLDAAGDNDGALDEGEAPGLELTLENVGVDPTTGVTATLSTGNAYVTVVEATKSFPGIPAGEFGTCTDPYEIEVAGDIPDGEVVLFELSVNSDQGTWDVNFSLEAQAPALAAAGCIVLDPYPGGNNDGNANAGEVFQLRLRVENSGQSAAEFLSGTISCSNAEVTILDATGDCALVPIGGDGTVSTFEVELSLLVSEPGHIDFDLVLSDAQGFSADLVYDLSVGGWFDDFEADHGWTVGYAGDDAGSGIWERVDPIGTEYNGNVVQPEDDHTPAPGTICFVTGNGSVGGSAGANDVDYGKTTLLSPVFYLDGATSASISYWRWYTNNLGNNPNEDYWDVDVTSDGENWVSLEHTTASENSWQQFSFELTDYIVMTDQVQIRFVASDEGAGALVEAGVDDFLLTAVNPIETAVDDESMAPTRLALAGNFPNPFNPKTTIRFALPADGIVELTVYNVDGRRVATLVNERMEAGHHELIWEGRDEMGHPVASGVYFSRIAFEGQVLTGKMMVLK